MTRDGDRAGSRPSCDFDLIFDVGMHRGEDTGFYLAKGFRTVAIDAHQGFCAEVGTRFGREVEDGRLTVLNRAISSQDGQTEFYESESSDWGTINKQWRDRNELVGVRSVATTVVESTTLASIMHEYGVPYYAKIDIEGSDLLALASIEQAPGRPKYVSIESNKVSFPELRREIALFEELGYRQFKVVPQRWVNKQRLPKPAREGKYVAHTFATGSSGAFGDEAPGRWMNAAETIDAYKRVFLGYALCGDERFIESRLVRGMLGVAGFRYNWYDTHARYGS